MGRHWTAATGLEVRRAAGHLGYHLRLSRRPAGRSRGRRTIFARPAAYAAAAMPHPAKTTSYRYRTAAVPVSVAYGSSTKPDCRFMPKWSRAERTAQQPLGAGGLARGDPDLRRPARLSRRTGTYLLRVARGGRRPLPAGAVDLEPDGGPHRRDVRDHAQCQPHPARRQPEPALQSGRRSNA